MYNALISEVENMDPELQLNLKRLVKWALYFMMLATIYLVFTYLFPMLGLLASRLPGIILPFVFAVLLALLIEPVVDVFEKYARLKRVWAVLVSLLLVITGFVLVVVAGVTVIIKEMSSLYWLALAYTDRIIGQVMSSVSDIKLFYLQLNLPPQLQNALQDNLQSGLELLQKVLNISIEAMIQAVGKLPGLLIFLAIAAVAAFLITKDRALIRNFVIGSFPESKREQTTRVISDLLKALSGFVKAYSILISITGILTMVSLKIMGVEYAFTLGVMTGLMDVLPIIGPGAVFIPWTLWEFITGHTSMAMGLLFVYVLITVVRQFAEPKIVGDSIGLHPLATLISLYVGLQLGGVAGMIMGPVVVVIFIAFYRAGLLQKWDWRKK
ncbi:MAG: sporulation integral membrane protein YtvI [Syntrophomonadaceae bacterium]